MGKAEAAVLSTLMPAVAAAGMRRVSSYRRAGAARVVVEEDCWVVEEQALFIDVAEIGLYTLMWTRTDIAAAAAFLPADGVLGDVAEPEALALCAGFLLTESMIETMADIAEMAFCPDAPNLVRVRLVRPSQVNSHRRGGFVASSCGICGGVDRAGDIRDGLPPVADTLRIDPTTFESLMAALQSRQVVFNRTGGTHAAALFSAMGALLASAEDLGRHNAMDKVIGQRLLQGLPTAGCGALLSGRVSLELIIKAARAGIELVAAVSAPSSLAIEAADQLGITLCGFVRQGRLTAFTHPQRLI
ncbi:formate dehydrogenase accessory sulfurtransferase FdhD [Herminiimonas sp. CN]|uniref:formate dehydrogenase accessory sulfurtransferase FdhD n=1 Tax=Herminiimonas sp. CN TaxID=1349818 RepID=UPI0004739893|nr:formate dehydrogenase accessory sulfurtransferase FdhD [Herminiimonas sp. CN]